MAQKQGRIKKPLPGDVLFYLYMKPNNIKQRELSDATGLDIATINRIIQGKGVITPRVALAFSKYFNNDKFYWMHIQNEYDFCKLEGESNDTKGS
jgi:addiction module HigA family antidote